MKILDWLVGLTSKIYISNMPLWISYKPEHHKLKGTQIRKVLDELQPGDIILRRFNGYLNTKFTPGFWGHSAIYCRENTIIHSVSAGVVEEDILDFCRTDSVIILRSNIDNIDIVLKNCQKFKDEKIKYDYQFEDGDNEFYCTEFINECFNKMFDDSFEIVYSKHILLPDGIMKSANVESIITFIND